MVSYKVHFVNVNQLIHPSFESVTIYMRKFLPHYVVKGFSLIYCAFDYLRHDILISRLDIISINDSALKWLNSYMINR